MSDETEQPGGTVETSAPAPAETAAPAPAPESVAATQPADSSTPSQPSAEAPETPSAEPPARKSFKQLLAEDPELNAEYQRELARTVNKRLAKQQRQSVAQEADAILQSEDAIAALDTLKKVRPLLEPAEDDEDESSLPTYQRKDWREKESRVQKALNEDRFWQKPERATIASLVLAEKRQEADKLWAQDPEQYHDWLQEQVLERIVGDRTRKQVPVLAEALATERVAVQMQHVPTLPTGGPPGGANDNDEFLRRFSAGESEDFARAAKLLGLRS